MKASISLFVSSIANFLTLLMPLTLHLSWFSLYPIKLVGCTLDPMHLQFQALYEVETYARHAPCQKIKMDNVITLLSDISTLYRPKIK